VISTLQLTPADWQAMRTHVDAHAPLEACGLLAGKNSQVQVVLLVRNQAQSPVRFVMDPLEQLHALEWIDENSLDLIAIFHSHPAGPEIPSETDIAEAAYEAVQVIWSRPQGVWQARGFWIEAGHIREVALEIGPSE
jgi:[CysO sulfur-carrier protein]-S-L-cysteine hydrolase